MSFWLSRWGLSRLDEVLLMYAPQGDDGFQLEKIESYQDLREIRRPFGWQHGTLAETLVEERRKWKNRACNPAKLARVESALYSERQQEAIRKLREKREMLGEIMPVAEPPLKMR